jgi:hypothetical protein
VRAREAEEGEESKSRAPRGTTEIPLSHRRQSEASSVRWQPSTEHPEHPARRSV